MHDKDLDILIKNCGEDTKEKVYLLSRLVAKLRNRESSLQVKYNNIKTASHEEVQALEAQLKKEKTKRMREIDSKYEKRSKMLHELEQRDHMIMKLKNELMSACDQDLDKISNTNRNVNYKRRQSEGDQGSEDYISDDKTCQMNFDSSSRDFFSQQRQIQSQLLDESEGPEQDESLIEYRGEQRAQKKPTYPESDLEKLERMTSPKAQMTKLKK